MDNVRDFKCQWSFSTELIDRFQIFNAPIFIYITKIRNVKSHYILAFNMSLLRTILKQFLFLR